MKLFNSYMFDFHMKRIYIIYMNKLTTTIASLIALASISLADVGTTSNIRSSDDVTVESVFASIGDLLLVRPVGTAVTIADFGIFAVASPFAAMADATDEVFNTLVVEPGEFTFKRDLVDFSR
jgi:hypothetical protein